jgi:hypothetical protein
MANERKRRRFINQANAPKATKWRESPMTNTPKKEPSNYLDKSLRSSADTSGQPSSSTIDTKGSSGSPSNSKNYAKNLTRIPSVDKSSSTAAVKDKMVSGLEKAAKKVPAYEAIKGIPTSKVATGLGRAAMLEAGPAIVAGTLAESADKYGRERGFGLQPRDVPKSSMSKKSDPIVDAINSDSDASTRAKSRGANREAMYGSQKDVSKAATPDVEIKKTEIVKTAPAVSKPAIKSGTSKPKGPTEGDRARNSMAAEWAKFSKGREADTAALKDITDRYEKTGTLVNFDDENARTKTEATEAMKKGGMTKRPPKPAKKVPPRKFASGGSTSRTSASKRGDGCATKGHTKGNMR